MSDDPIEWGFKVPASQVDLDRIVAELLGRPVVEVTLYLSLLRKNAPAVYGRLVDHAAKNDLLKAWSL